MTPEFSRPFKLERLGAGAEILVQADEGECESLARRYGVPAVPALACRFHLRSGPSANVLAEGELRARVVQVCVVSLDEFEDEVSEDFRVVFVPAGTESDELDPDADDELPYEGGIIDLGEAAAEQLALALDPYPRKPGMEEPELPEEGGDSPFEALSRALHGRG
jgi:uncharacterized metal-binding protein YceD (DUF177 family)